MAKQLIHANRIGCFASQSLEAISVGKVMGSTSKGLFLLFGKFSLFVTPAQGLSPFNIVLTPDSVLPSVLESNDEVFYSLNELLIPSRQVIFSLQDAEIWTPALPMPALNSIEEQKNRIQLLIAEVTRLVSDKGFLFLAEDPGKYNGGQQEVRQLTGAFTSAFTHKELVGCLKAARELFGRGGGLTPSGDDWITGFMLFQVRVRTNAEEERAFIYETCRSLTDLAYEKTTFISANRLEAAGQGWSEELFLRVVDYVTGKRDENLRGLAQILVNFGHSSGVDTLMGISAAIQAS